MHLRNKIEGFERILCFGTGFEYDPLVSGYTLLHLDMAPLHLDMSLLCLGTTLLGLETI